MSHEVNYFQLGSFHGFELLIKSPTRVTCYTSSLTDHILTSLLYGQLTGSSQQGIIDVGIPNHQLIYCTRNSSRTKVGTHKKSHSAH